MDATTRGRTATVLLALLLLASHAASEAPPPGVDAGAAADALPGPAADAADPPHPLSKAAQLVERAMDIRDDPDASDKDLKKAVEYLYAAAGIEHMSVERRRVGGGEEGVGADDDAAAYVTAADVNITWRNGTMAYEPAVRELIYVFREGDGAPLNPALAHRLLQELAARGDPESQADLGFYLAQGVEPVAPNAGGQLFRLRAPDVPAALVHYHFAARAGDPVAQMNMAYRYYHGLGVPKSCESAALYYAPVAERVLELARQPDTLPAARALRLSHKTALSFRSRPTSEQEFLHYQWFADYGHADAARAVAHLLSHGAARDHAAALQYLRQAADAGDADAMAHLGHMYANGLAVDADNGTAWKWFWRAAERGHASGFFGMGYMHVTGEGAEVDHKQAFHYFKQAVEGGSQWSGVGDAMFFLGMMHLKGWGTPLDLAQAAAMFGAAAASGNLLAAYNLAVLHLRGAAGEPKGPASCRAAVKQLKRVAERAWPALAEANDDFAAGDYEWALLNYLKAAEWGSELGQSNAAWMLSEGYGYEGPRAGELAVSLFRRAAEQGNSAAFVRLGDSYWYGKGVARDWVRAGKAYAAAARHRIPQALFNLGYMHQRGAGVAKDLHLAKRYYDRASGAAEDAWLAASLALTGLKVQSWWERAEPAMPAAVVRAVRYFAGPRGGDAGANGTAAAAAAGAAAAPTRSRRGGVGLAPLLWAFDALDALCSDSTAVLWVAALLGLVLWRRQTVRARAAAHAAQQGWPPAGAGAGGQTTGRAAAMEARQGPAREEEREPLLAPAPAPAPEEQQAPADGAPAGAVAPADDVE